MRTLIMAALMLSGCSDSSSGRAGGEASGAGEAAAGEDGDGGGDEGGAGPGGGEVQGEGGEGGGEGIDPAPDRPQGLAAIWIAVDDRAGGTYRDGQLKWNGSFEWKESDNTVVFSASWLPHERPYPVLRDDGPLSEGGHEPEGQTAGDGVHSTVVYVDASAGDVTVEYGVINEFDNWIWLGTNGLLTVPEGSVDAFEAAGLTITGFGDVDVRITLDNQQLDPLVYPDGLPVEDAKVYLKGTLTNWAPVLVRDDGKRGDVEAGDGVFTYQQSERLGSHEGLLSDGQQAQFVWMHLFDPEGEVKEDGREYKATAEALPAGVPTFDEPDPDRRSAVYASPVGVSAWSRAPGGEWTDEPVGLALESRGATWNTAVEVTPTPGDGSDEAGQNEGAEGVDEGVAEGVDEGSEEGAHGEGAGELGEGEGQGEGDNEGGDEGDVEGSGDIEVLLIEPAVGPSGGGSVVVVTGRGFTEDAVVTFGGIEASGVLVAEGGRRLECRTPAHDPGAVEVRVTVDEDFGVFQGGFTYREGDAEAVAPDWASLWTPHAVETVSGVPTEDLFCRVYQEGMTEGDGDGGALCEVGFGPDGTHPEDDADQWIWSAMRYSAQRENDDEYVGSVVSDNAGAFDLAVRVSLDNGRSWAIADRSPEGLNDGYDPATAGELLVREAPKDPELLRVTPTRVSFTGGGELIIHGFHLAEAQEVRVGRIAVRIVEALATRLTVELPPGDPGPRDLEVDVDGDTLTLPGAFRYLGPAVDGAVADWPDRWWLATQDVESAWGAANVLTAVGAVSDGDRLWIAVRGNVEALNAIVGYVDIDPGSGTGATDLGALSDADGALDVALSGPITVDVAGGGVDLAFGTVGMASAQGFAGPAGWRRLAPADDFGWLEETLIADGEAGVIETSVALPEGAAGRASIFVRITNAAGQVLSNQCLPADDPDSPGAVSAVMLVTIP